MTSGIRKLVATKEELDILNYWYEIKLNLKGQDPLTGFYLSSKRSHTGYKFVNAENDHVKSEKYQIEVPLPMCLWHLAESAPGSRITPATKAELNYIKVNGLVRSYRGEKTAKELREYNKLPPKGIRFGGYRSVEEAAAVVKSWIESPFLFIEAVKAGSGGAKYYQ
jgi:hypothetical protein